MFSLSSSSSSSFPPGLPYLLEVRVSYPGSAVAYYCSPGHRVEVGQGPLLPCLQDSAHGCCEHSVRYNNTSRGGNPLRHNLHHHRLILLLVLVVLVVLVLLRRLSPRVCLFASRFFLSSSLFLSFSQMVFSSQTTTNIRSRHHWAGNIGITTLLGLGGGKGKGGGRTISRQPTNPLDDTFSGANTYLRKSKKDPSPLD